jgi:integrase/recombinase XerD
MTKNRGFGENRMNRVDVFRMINSRCAAAEMGSQWNLHTFRATGIIAYLLNCGSIEGAQAIAAHESLRTTKLYDRLGDAMSLTEIERITI